MKVLIELEVTGGSPEVILEAVRCSLGCEELQDRAEMNAHKRGHSGVKVTAYDVISEEQAIGGLRDELAGKAMQSIWLHPHFLEASEEKIAAEAYEQADKMLAARSRKPTPTTEEA